MCRKLTYLISFILVPSFVLPSVTSGVAPDPDVGWWKFDEGSGSTALDSSGNGHDGTISGAEWTSPGWNSVGHCLDFDGQGSDRVSVGTFDVTGSGITIACWFKADNLDTPGNDPRMISKAIGGNNDEHWFMISSGRQGDVKVLRFRLKTDGATGELKANTTTGNIELDVWTHMAATWDGSMMRLYKNGVEVGSLAKGGTLSTDATVNVSIGNQPAGTGDRPFDGLIDEVRIYSYALSEAQIKDLMKGLHPKAWDPDPPDGADNVTSQLLQWTAGDYAAFHDIYVGTNPVLGPDEFMKRDQYAMYWYEPGFIPGTTYYWRVDEVEADGTTIHTGDVWSFTATVITAWKPYPADGASYVPTDTVLSWEAGASAILHDVYFGADETEVAEGTGDTFKNTVTGTSYQPEPLAKDTTYYWRIDEFDGATTHKGEVWSFSTVPDIPIADPNLVAWWKLDEGSGTTALDSSGHDHHGVLAGDPQWVAGYDGGALEFDNEPEDRVSAGTFDVQGSGIAIACWFKADNLDTIGSDPRMVSKATGGAADAHWFMLSSGRSGGLYVLRFRLRTTDGQATTTLMADAEGTIELDEWIHAVATWDGTTMRIYKNGIEVGSTDKGGDAIAAGPTVKVAIGNQPQGAEDRPFDGIIDDVRIYNKGVTAADIPEIMRGDTSVAWDPSPADGSTTDVEKAVPLSWSPGDKAAQHDVYLGMDQAAVRNADTSDTTGIYQGRQNTASYTPVEALEFGQTYYWRIDEFNTDGTISRGRIWSFAVADYLIVDDFEDYDDFCNRIFFTWTDGWGHSGDVDCGVPSSAGNGTGSTVGNLAAPFAEQTIVHSGGQSMPFEYNNSGTGAKARYSEAQREWASPQDWTRKAVKALTLYFYGDPANAAEQLYVALQDNAGQVRVVNHPNPDAVQAAAWQEWNVELTRFSGANLKAVKKLYIGLGNRVSPAAGGTGKIYIDDIRLYRPRCVPSLAKPAASFNNDCVVDYLDLQMMAQDWLLSDVAEDVWNGTFSSQDIGAPAAGSFSFDGQVYTIQADGHDIWDNADDFHYAYRQISGDCQITARVTRLDPVHSWAKAGVMIRDTLDAGSANAMIAATGGDGNGGTFQWRTQADGSSSSSRTLTGISPPACVRLARKGDTFTGYIFLDGQWQQEGQSATVPMTDPVHIGLAVTSHTDGTLTTATFDRACTFSAAELHADGVVDFKDFAVLADMWLDEILWP